MNSSVNYSGFTELFLNSTDDTEHYGGSDDWSFERQTRAENGARRGASHGSQVDEPADSLSRT